MIQSNQQGQLKSYGTKMNKDNHNDKETIPLKKIQI